MSSFTSLHDVLDKGNWNLENIKTFLQQDSSSVNAVDSNGDTPLFRVLKNNDCSVDVVKLLLDYGSNVDCTDKNGSTPLIIALVSRRNVDFINLVLKKGANINVLGPSGVPVICLALMYSSNDVLQLVLDAGCLPSRCKIHGTALHCAILNLSNHPMKEGVLQLLIDKGADVKAVDQSGRSVLCFALTRGLPASNIKILLAAGGVLNCTKHTNPFHCATISPELRADVVQLLLEQGACVNIDVIQHAMKQRINETTAIELMLDHLQEGDAKDFVDKSSNTLLHITAGNPRVQKSVVKLLVKRGVAVNRVNRKGDTALHKMVKHECGMSRVIKTLLKSGSRVNVKNRSGETPLHVAMQHVHDPDTLKVLLAAGAHIGVAGYSLLEVLFYMDLSDNREQRLKCLKMLMKCYFLEKPNFDFQDLISSHPGNTEELIKFGFDCVHELQKLDSTIIGEDRTLREFVKVLSPFQAEAANFVIDVNTIIFDQLLKLIAEHAFPLFLDIIAAKVGRSSMKLKLQKLQVYTYLSDESRVGEKVVLKYNTVYKIGDLLTDDDLLRFISAFNKTGDQSLSEDDKRSDEHCHKRPKMHL